MGDVVAKPPDADTPAQSFPERLMGIFISPVETLADVARKPDFLAPLIVLILATVAVTEILLWKVGLERLVRMGLEQSSAASRMSPEQLEQVVHQQVRIGTYTAHLGAVLGVPIILLILAGLGILIVNVIFGGRAKFKTVFSEICYADLVTLLGSLMAIALIWFGDPDHFNQSNPIPSNIGYFLNPHEVSKPLYSLASSIDIFTIWFLILMSIGLAEATGRKVKPLSVFLVYGGIWVLWILVKVGWAVIF
jgi:hypothetical protein